MKNIIKQFNYVRKYFVGYSLFIFPFTYPFIPSLYTVGFASYYYAAIFLLVCVFYNL